jgi:hypothetical protein
MPAAAIAIPAAIKAGTSIAGAVQGRNATNDAVSALLNSFTQAGNTATDAVNKVNPQIQNNANGWSANVIGAGSDAADWATDQANKGVAGVNDAVKAGQGMLQPYSDTGTSALSTLSNLLQKPQQFNYQADPGYQFRLSEGQKQISRMAAAHGAAGGGGTAKAAAQYSSGLASQEYGNAWNRWNTSNQERQGGLATIAGMGERAGEYSGDLGMRGSQFNAGLLQNAAQYGGNMKVGTTQWAGNLQSHATDEQANNSLDLGNFLANLQMNAGRTTAAGDISKGNIWGQLIPQLGQQGADLFSKLYKPGGNGYMPPVQDPSKLP